MNALLTETYKFNFVGGAVGQMTGASNLEDVYISGMIVLDNHQEGGVVGELNSGTVNHVVENMRIKSFIIPGNTWQGKYYYANKAGVVGDVNNSSAGLKNWKITNCLALEMHQRMQKTAARKRVINSLVEMYQPIQRIISAIAMSLRPWEDQPIQARQL